MTTDGFRDAIRPETRLVFGETLGNPGLEIMDVAAVAEIAHDAGVPFMLDNTFATPYLFRPFEWGADLIYHSITKFIGGHGVAVGGALIDGGTFDWEASGRFPTLTEPYPSYHGLIFTEEFGTQAFIIRARVEGLRDFGAPLAPQNAFYILQGTETLSIRMRKHVENTREGRRVPGRAERGGLDQLSGTTRPSRPRPGGAADARWMRGRFWLSASKVDGRPAGGSSSASGSSPISPMSEDAKSLVIHPASTTHSTMDADQLARAGVGEDLIRLSVGLEDPSDLIGDLTAALRASRK